MQLINKIKEYKKWKEKFKKIKIMRAINLELRDRIVKQNYYNLEIMEEIETEIYLCLLHNKYYKQRY